MASVIQPIPSPPRLPLIGHLHRIPKGRLVRYLVETARNLPGLFAIDFAGREAYFATSPDIVAELNDEKRFRKMPGPALRSLRPAVGDGLFTAFQDEPNWGKAHRILLPAFGQRAMKGYFGLMREVVDQLVAKWSAAEGGDVQVADDMTRLTLDSIAIAGFGYRFDSFADERLDPFLAAMVRALGEAMDKLTRLPIQRHFNARRDRQFAADIAEMNTLVDRIIADRRRNPGGGSDLLALMLDAVDPVTGETLDDVNIRYQILTFLVAGHETTSGLLTFALYLLQRHPQVLAQAYAEVDRVLPGDRVAEYADIAEFDVIDRVLKEALRLWPTAPAYSVAPYEDAIVGGCWRIPKDRPVNVLMVALHRDPAAWPDPETFDIDRFLPEAEAVRHPHAYKPFGNGVRACIGRQFALTEAKLALAVLLQHFDLSDPHDYRLDVKETLTLKPDAFRLRVRRRRAHERGRGISQAPAAAAVTAAPAGAGQSLVVAHGTSLGTAREIAAALAARAVGAGFDARAVALDDLADALPADGLLVVVTATYNGLPPDNAQRFAAMLAAGLPSRPGLRYGVLGIGNSQWPNYQAFPLAVEAALAATGAIALLPRGAADGDGDFDGAVEDWIETLWTVLGAEAQPTAPLQLAAVATQDLRAEALPLSRFTVLANDELVRPADGLWDFAREAPRGPTRHLRLVLPPGETYAVGDHLAVYARNRPDLVDAVIARLGVDAEALVRPQGDAGRFGHLPLGHPVTVRRLLTDFVELREPATRRAARRLLDHVRCPHTRGQIEALVTDESAFHAAVTETHVALFDLLLRFPAVELPLPVFVELCPPVQPRLYSIASSPLATPDEVHLLVGTIDAPAWSGLGRYQGFASTYIRDLVAGDIVSATIRKPNPPFAPPADPLRKMILIGPGTGLAPYRGFLAERAAQRRAGTAVAPAMLFFGCRHPEHDWLYRAEIERWAADGLVDLHLAFSAVAGHAHRFVQDALWAAREAVWQALGEGAEVFVCGDGRWMAPAVRETLMRMHGDRTGADRDASSRWLDGLRAAGRYHQDVFGFAR